MGKLTRKRSKKKGVVRRAYDKVESKVMVAAGRRAVRKKLKAAKRVLPKAAKAALIAGGVAAAKVVWDEVRKRPNPA